MRNWKRRYQETAWDMIMCKVFHKGLRFKADNIKKVAVRTGIIKETIYRALRDGRDGFNPDCPTIHKILEKFDPVLDFQFLCEPKNVWSRIRARKEGF